MRTTLVLQFDGAGLSSLAEEHFRQLIETVGVEVLVRSYMNARSVPRPTDLYLPTPAYGTASLLCSGTAQMLKDNLTCSGTAIVEF